MSALYALIIISLLIAVGFLAAFVWAVKTGQFSDGYTPSVRMLFDDSVERDPSGEGDVLAAGQCRREETESSNTK